MNLSSDQISHDESDFKLILEDDYQIIKLHPNKNILCLSSEYFQKMFLFNKNLHFQRMIVPNAEIMSDIILSFTGQNTHETRTSYPNWLYILEKIKCHNYLCLVNDMNELYNL